MARLLFPRLRSVLLTGAVGLAAVVAARADISFTLGGANLQTALTGQNLPVGSLIQLVNLGSDGVFNPIVLNDGGSQWVSGDDSLVTAAYTVGGAAGDFASAAAFDLEYSASASTPDSTAGFLSRAFSFNFGTLATGTKLGIRWFPGLQATQYASLSGPATGQVYGQFTRQSSPLNGGVTWTVPSDGVAVNFDPLLTLAAGGSDPNSAGVASWSVIPEPSSSALLVAGAFLAGRRQRRAFRLRRSVG